MAEEKKIHRETGVKDREDPLVNVISTNRKIVSAPKRNEVKRKSRNANFMGNICFVCGKCQWMHTQININVMPFAVIPRAQFLSFYPIERKSTTYTTVSYLLHVIVSALKPQVTSKIHMRLEILESPLVTTRHTVSIHIYTISMLFRFISNSSKRQQF